MAINIEFKLLGIFQRLSGKKHFQMKLDNPVSVKKVIMILSEMFTTEFNKVLIDPKLNFRPNALILINGKEVSTLQGLETEVNDSDEIVLVPIIHGG